jgi:heavy metal translocating P-type ATPase
LLSAAINVVKATMTPARWFELSRIAGTGFITLLFWQQFIPQWVLLVAVAVGLYPLVKIGLVDLVRHRKIGTELFVSLATLIALATGEVIAGSVIMVIILIAEFIAQLNTDRARASIRNLVGSTPQTATLKADGVEQTVSIAQLQVGDIVLVRAGEKFPVDGDIVAGEGSVNEAPITGESIPKEKAAGDSIFAGTVLTSGAMDVRTLKVGADTTFARIIKLVEEAQEHQAPVQKLTDKVAAWLLPVVLIFLAFVFAFTRDARLIVTLLFFSSPAELGLATPLVMVSAIARAARSGILVKGGIYLELLAKCDVMVFDKTGTLTTGSPQITSVIPVEGVETAELMRLAAAADRRSSHPLALAVVAYATRLGMDIPEPDEFQTLQGRGVRAVVEGQVVLLGTASLLQENDIQPPVREGHEGQTFIYAAANGRAMGILYLADQIRPEAADAIRKLKASGVKRIVMLTGDNASTARAVGAELGIDEIHADLLPQDKVEQIRSLQSQNYRVAMIGDGINDAPALAAADIGVAMGVGGTQAALEAADVALMTDDLEKIVLARTIARRAYRTIKENLFFGVAVVHGLGIIAALLGLIGPIAAALIHLGPDVLVFLNSVKLLRIRLE